MNHFQWNAQNQLNGHVDEHVQKSNVDEHVGEETPDLFIRENVEIKLIDLRIVNTRTQADKLTSARRCGL